MAEVTVCDFQGWVTKGHAAFTLLSETATWSSELPCKEFSYGKKPREVESHMSAVQLAILVFQSPQPR